MKTLTADNCLAATHPEVARHWSDRNELTPYDVFPGCNERAWFRCPAGVHDDAFVIINSRRLTNSCRECAQIASSLPRRGESFGELRPDLLDEWDPQNLASPYMVGPKSAQVVGWVCRSNSLHQWQMPIHSRSDGARCPFCTRHRAHPTESLAATHPTLLAEWHPDNALHPTEIYATSHRIVWWLCGTCDCEWKASPLSRTIGSRCPDCFPRGTSVEETVVLDAIEAALGVEVERNVKVAHRCEVDGLVRSLGVAIDYDGAYWHGGEAAEEKDRRKSERVVAAGYRMIRVRQWPLTAIEGTECVVGDASTSLAGLAIRIEDVIGAHHE